MSADLLGEMAAGPFNDLLDGVAIVGDDGLMVAANRAMRSLFVSDSGALDEALGHTIVLPAPGEAQARTDLQRAGRVEPVTVTARRLGDSIMVIWPAALDDEETSRLRREATHDALTGLATRTAFIEQLTTSLARIRRSGGQLSVVFCDLDGFKSVNDSRGHDAGDAILIEVARRITATVRASDVVARFGGDEFVVLVNEMTERNDSTFVAERLVEAISRPIALSDGDAHVGASIGIAVTDDGTIAPEVLMTEADSAMYHVKASGKGSYREFDDLLRSVAHDRRDLETSLRKALEERDLKALYQPVVDLASGTVVAFDATMRWAHPTRGELPAAEWIALAEDVGVIVDIDHWLLDTACHQLQQWRTSRPEHEALTCWLTVSARQLLRPDFTDTVASVLAKASADPGTLGIGLTEAGAGKHPAEARRVLEALSSLGVRIALEDFSGGYFAPAQLQDLPVDTVRLHRSYMDFMGDPMRAQKALAGVVAMVRHLELDVAVKGVDNATHLTRVLQLRCQHAQGEIFAPAQGAEAAAGFLRRNYRWSLPSSWDSGDKSSARVAVDESEAVGTIAGLGSPALQSPES